MLFIILLVVWTRPAWEEPFREFVLEPVSNTFHSAKEFTTKTINNNIDFNQMKNQARSLYSLIIDSIQDAEMEQLCG